MEQFQDFWDLVVQVWHEGFLGVDVGSGVVALGIILGFLILRGLLSRFIIGSLRVFTKRTPWKINDLALEAIAPPMRAVPVVLGLFVAIYYLELEGQTQEIATDITRTMITMVLFWALYRAIEPISSLFGGLERIISHEFVVWIVKALRVVVIVVGAATILQLWGIQIGPIIAGAGLFGVAVALGAQDLFKNLIAGILILGERRFRHGDWVRVEGLVEGTVESIGFRSTVVRRFDKAPVMVPNAQLSDTAVINFSQMMYRRIYWHIGVEYSTSIEQLREIRDGIEQYIVDHKDFVPAERASTFVRIDRFSDSSIDILVYCFTETTKWGDWLKIKEDLAYSIMDIVHKAGTGFAFPSTSLYVESIPSERPEAFVPPGSAEQIQSPSPDSDGTDK
jgi:MscS family membrane protein